MGAGTSKQEHSSYTFVPAPYPPKPALKAHDDDLDIPILILNIDIKMTDAVNRNFLELKSKNDEVRVKAAHEIYAAVVAAVRGEETLEDQGQLTLLT